MFTFSFHIMNTVPSWSKILVYQAPNGAIKLKGDVKHETIWANLNQIAELFWRDKSVISRHIKNIYKSGELKENQTVAKIATVQLEGKKQVIRKIEHFNLDMIISIWYRVNSKTATKFRQRSTQTLKKHITQWYTINPDRITHNYTAFLDAVKKVQHLNTQKVLWSNQVLELIKMFAHTWFSLDAYDKDWFSSQWQTQQTISLHGEELYTNISILKQQLIAKWETTELFAQEKQKESLTGILGNVFQTIWWEEVYPSIESKGAHLLYFIVKNHPFIDGNKRSWAFAFIRFLQKAGLAFHHTITPEALTALTLLVATSNPKDKERIIELIILLIQGK